MASARIFVFPGLAALLLFTLTRLHFSYWPFAWPDEALFSSPAAELARGASFATPVLNGLLPGMERATLWNSPLFMVLLGGIYSVTGESLLVARGFALFTGILALFVFFAAARRLLPDARLAGILTLLLACDPTFHRAANIARMDMLTLFFLLSALYCLSGARAGEAGRRPAFFLAGICTGLAGLSHPGGILGVPLILIFALPGRVTDTGEWSATARRVALGATGTFLGISPWLFYILPNLELFEIQFLSQVLRKQGMLKAAAGGDTGGVLVVFFAQYGGTRMMMMIAALALGTTFAGALVRLFLETDAERASDLELRRRVYLSFAVLTVLVILASEAWYPLFVGPFWLIALGLLLKPHPTRLPDVSLIARPAIRNILENGLRLIRPLAFAAGTFFIIAPAVFAVRHRLLLDTPAKVAVFEKQVLNAAATCQVMYLRVRPDPYFRLREIYPRMEVLEFVPGKLQIGAPKSFFQEEYGVPDFEAYLERRYESIDCFLLDDHGDWEPRLTDYLDRNAGAFTSQRIRADAPLESVTLWRRR